MISFPNYARYSLSLFNGNSTNNQTDVSHTTESYGLYWNFTFHLIFYYVLLLLIFSNISWQDNIYNSPLDFHLIFIHINIIYQDKTRKQLRIVNDIYIMFRLNVTVWPISDSCQLVFSIEQILKNLFFFCGLYFPKYVNTWMKPV